MRVMHAVLDNRIGGVQVRALEVALRLCEYDVETQFLVPMGEGTFDVKARAKGFKVHRVSTMIRPRRLELVLEDLKWLFALIPAIFAIYRLIHKEQIDIVHSNGLLCLQPLLAAYLAQKPVVCHLIGSHYPPSVVSATMPIIKYIANCMVVVAEQMKAYYLLAPSDTKISVLHEPVDEERFSPDRVSLEVQRYLRKEFKISNSDKIVGCVANITPVKGLEYFIRTAALVTKRIKNVKFVLVGPKQKGHERYYAQLQHLTFSLGLEGQVIFAGQRNDIREFLSIVDVFLLPSLMEGTPIAIQEAMAMQVPVVATQIAGIPAQVIEGVTGFMVSPRDVVAMADRVICLLENKTLRSAMGANGRQHIVEKFSLKSCIYGHKLIYEALINRRNPKDNG